MEKYCISCKYGWFGADEYPCNECVRNNGVRDLWESKDCESKNDDATPKLDGNMKNPDAPKTRADFLKEVEGIICKDRNEQYGEPEDNFKRIAVFWSNYLDREITSADVAIMMVLFKAARIATGHNKEDNWIDIAGYSLCGAECAIREK